MRACLSKLFVVFAALLSTSAIAQDWRSIPGGLKYISAVNGTTAWGVNSADNIYRTNNGGATWQLVPGALKQVSALSYDMAWGVSSADGVFRTNNGGANWDERPGNFANVSAVSYDTAWGVKADGSILRTNNAGSRWQQVPGTLKQVSALSYDSAWGVNSGNSLFRTNNGGASWDRRPGSMTLVFAVSYDIVWGVDANDAVFRSNTAGASWQSVPRSLRQVSALSYDSAWGVSAANEIYFRPGSGSTPSHITLSEEPHPLPAGATSVGANNVVAQVNNLAAREPIDLRIRGGIASEAETHIQGMAVVGNYWVYTHNTGYTNATVGQCGGEYGNSPEGDLIFIDRRTNNYAGTHEINFGSCSHINSAQGAGPYLAVNPGKRGDSHVRFYKVEDVGSGTPEVTELTHLRLTGEKYGCLHGGTNHGIQNVSIAYHHRHQRYYVMVQCSSFVRMAVSDKNGPVLENSTSWISVPIDNNNHTPYGEAGAALIYEKNTGNFYYFALGSEINGKSYEENSFFFIKLAQSDPSSPLNKFVRDTRDTAIDANNFRNLKDGEGSFRWGGTVYVDEDGFLNVVQTERDYSLILANDQTIWASTCCNGTGSASAPANRTYEVQIQTGTSSGAGTDSNIFLTITGANGRTPEQRLNGLLSGNAFENGDLDRLSYSAVDVGEISSIQIRSDNRYAGSGWQLNWIKINGKQFNCNCWIDGDSLVKTLR